MRTAKTNDFRRPRIRALPIDPKKIKWWTIYQHRFRTITPTTWHISIINPRKCEDEETPGDGTGYR